MSRKCPFDGSKTFEYYDIDGERMIHCYYCGRRMSVNNLIDWDRELGRG